MRALTRGPVHHWFGCYDKTPWSPDGRHLLAMESSFADRMPRPGDRIRLGLIDAGGSGRFEPFAETQAWCWQTGCMLQWLPGTARTVTYNVREEGRFAAVVHNLDSGARRVLPRPVFCLTPDGRTALSLNFARLARYRPGYGYEGVADPFANELAPDGDGVWRMDIDTGESRLVLSLAALSAMRHTAEMDGVAHRVNHIQINTDGTRFAVLHRYMRRQGSGLLTRMVTAGLDGAQPWLLHDNRMASHYDWRDANSLLVWARQPGTTPENPHHAYLLLTDLTDAYELVGEGLFPEGDGHCSYSPDRRWVITDSYPRPLEAAESRRAVEQAKGGTSAGSSAVSCSPAPLFRTLMLYHPAENRRVDIGRFLAPPPYEGDIRCDLHPRWSRDGAKVCFDSVHEGTRQMYEADLPPAAATPR